MSQYEDFVAANIGYGDQRIPEVPENIDEPGFATTHSDDIDYNILDHEAEVEEWERVNEGLMPHIDEWDEVPAETPAETPTETERNA